MGRPISLADRLLHHANVAPDRVAIADSNRSLTYAELAERVTAQAARWADAGLAAAPQGAAVVVGLEHHSDAVHLIQTLALARLEVTSCTLASHESPDQQRMLLRRAGVAWVVAADGALQSISPDPLAGADPVLCAVPGAKLLFATSGTTGEPKIVCQSDAGLVAQAHRHVGPSERFACLASMEHNFSRRHRLYCVAEGATNVFLGGAPETLVEESRSLDLTTLHLSAFQAREVLGIPGVRALGGLRLKLGGSHVPAPLRDALRQQVTSNLQCGYGTTETGAIAFTDPLDTGSAESVGRVLPGIEIRVGDAAQASTGLGAVAIRCEGMFLGYLGQPELTAQRLVAGWFHTGDVGRLDDGLRLHLDGRSDDMFVFNSMNIHPQDIEAHILEHPAVRDAVVLPQHSPVHGDVPVALVVADGSSPHESP